MWAPAPRSIRRATFLPAAAAGAAARSADRRHEIRRFALEAFGQVVERAFVVAGIGHEPSALDEQFIEAAASNSGPSI